MSTVSTYETMNVFGLQTFCLLTGASKGFGQAMAVRFAAKLPKDSVVLLTARSAQGLAATRAMIDEKAPHVRVLTVSMDLSNSDRATFEQTLGHVLHEELGRQPNTFDQALIIHNAASLGDVSKVFTEQCDDKELQSYWHLNLTSFTVLNHVFLKFFPRDAVKQRVVIGISSICALQPFKSWSIYCAGKAARDMLLRTMALEDSSLRVLNYAPGPIDTEMQQVARTETADEELKNMFMDFKDNKKLLSCDESIDKLIPLLEKNNFDSGSHIDYYDI